MSALFAAFASCGSNSCFFYGLHVNTTADPHFVKEIFSLSFGIGEITDGKTKGIDCISVQ